MRTSREAPGEYGRRFRNVPMAFEVVEATETEDFYEVTLSFRPQGAFTGTQGQEQFFIEKEGNVAVRQVLSLPTAAGGRRFPLGLVAVGLVVVVAAAVGGVFAATSGSDGPDDSSPQVAADLPTSAPVPFMSTSVPVPTTAPAMAPPLGATATPNPTVLTATTIPMLVATLTASSTPTPQPKPTVETAAPTTPVPTPLPTPSPTPLPGIPAGSFVEIQYDHRLVFVIDRAFGEQWESRVVPHNSRWDITQSEPISLSASLDGPLDLRDGTRPLSPDQAQGENTYSWLPKPRITIKLERQLAVDSGLRLSRTVTPEILPPGTTQVVIDVTVEVLRPPTVRGVTVSPVGGHVITGLGGQLEFQGGAESRAYGAIKPVRIISVSGPRSQPMGPLWEPGQKYNLRTEAAIENPNPFPVSFLPSVAIELDFDTDSDEAPYKVEIPIGIQANAPTVSFDAVGIAGVGVEFTLSNPSQEKVFWVVSSPGFVALLQFWWGRLQVTP